MIKQRDYASLTPKKLWSDDGADKVLAIIELLTNPKAYEEQMQRVRDQILANEALLEKISKGQDIEVLSRKADIALDEAYSKADKAAGLLLETEERVSALMQEAETKATKMKTDAQRYVLRNKEGSQKVEILQKQLDALILKNTKENKRVVTERTKLVTERKKFQERYTELQKRFAEV